MPIFFSAETNQHLVTTTTIQVPPSSSTSTDQPPAELPAGTDLHTSQQSTSKGGIHFPSAIANLLHLHLSSPKALPAINELTPTFTPKDDISSLRSFIHGPGDWSSLLNPLHPSLRHEILKYGEFSQATYDAFDNNPGSEYRGSSLYGRRRLLQLLGLSRYGYSITRYIYATSHINLPRWLVKPFLTSKSRWCDESNWMGFVAVSGDAESRRIGCRDITVAWRGTVSASEWIDDLQARLVPLPGAPDQEGTRVEQGFLSLYTSRSDSSKFTRSSASEQVMREIRRLVDFYKNRGEIVSLTITGHSLGGAIALLNAAESAANLPPDVSVTVISFGAPRVGNELFGEMLKRRKVKILRVATKQDLVPKVPGVVFNEDRKGEGWEWVYTHVGDELVLDIETSMYLKSGVVDVAGFHGLETYLHLVDGHEKEGGVFRARARRDVALVNKFSGLLREELAIPACWYQPANKGMVRNDFGRWVVPRRAKEDIPSPCTPAPAAAAAASSSSR